MHNYNIRIWVTQILFSDSLRSLSQNAHYFVLMHSQRSLSQLAKLASQLGMKDRIKKTFSRIVNDIEPYTHILIDLSPQSEPEYSVRSHIFPEHLAVIYRQLMNNFCLLV